MMLFIYTHPVNSNFKIWQQYQISSFNGIYVSLKFYTPFFPSGYILLSILKKLLIFKNRESGNVAKGYNSNFLCSASRAMYQ